MKQKQREGIDRQQPQLGLFFFLLSQQTSAGFHSPPPGSELHHHVVDPPIPAGGVWSARHVVVVSVDVNEQTSLIVGFSQHPRSPHRLPPVGTLVLPVGAVECDRQLGAVLERALKQYIFVSGGRGIRQGEGDKAHIKYGF